MRNLGRTIGRHLADDGWRIAGVARSSSSIEAFVKAVPGAAGIVADVREAAEAERAVREASAALGSLDLIVGAITVTPARFSAPLPEDTADALEPFTRSLLPAIFNVIRVGATALDAQGHGTLVQVTGKAALRAGAQRGPWSVGAFGTRALVHAAAAELRERGVHVALLVAAGTIESDKTRESLAEAPEERALSEDAIAAGVAYLASQSPRAWTHELVLTPRLEEWLP